MSPDFEAQNFVAERPQGMSFRLGISRTTGQAPTADYQIHPLADAAKRDWYQDLLAEGFPCDKAFLCKLTEFLPKTNALYLNISLGGRPYAMTNLAVAGGMALILNGVVSSSMRGQGLAGILHKIASYEAYLHGSKELFFWTKHEGLLRYSENSAFYNIKAAL